MDIIKTILDKTDPIIDLIVENEKNWHIEKNLPYSKYSEECTRLGAKFKLGNSIAKHLYDSDEVIDTNFDIQAGRVVANIDFKRNDKNEQLNTELIIAGGYNIQRAHYRYITKSTIKRTPNPDVNKAYLKVLSLELKVTIKEAALMKDIDSNNVRIENYKNEILERLEYSFDDKLKAMERPDSRYTNVYERILSKSWETFNSERETNPCHNHEVLLTEDQYNEYIQEITQEVTDRNDRRIKSLQVSISQIQKYNTHLNNKLTKLRTNA